MGRNDASCVLCYMDVFWEKEEEKEMKNIIGKILFYCRFPYGVTGSIADTTEYGYGQLSDNGFWKYPVPCWLVKRRQRKAKEKKNGKTG